MALTLDKVYSVTEKLFGKAQPEESAAQEDPIANIVTKNPEYEQLMAESARKIKALEERCLRVEVLPVLAFDEQRLKELICTTFLDNKKHLMKKGVAETIKAALLQKLSNEIMHQGAEQLNRVEKIAQDLKKMEAPSAHHKHQEDRSKYPADYDSSSDYEVRKLADIIKTVDDLKRSQDDLRKQVAANQTTA